MQDHIILISDTKYSMGISPLIPPTPPTPPPPRPISCMYIVCAVKADYGTGYPIVRTEQTFQVGFYCPPEAIPCCVLGGVIIYVNPSKTLL